MSVRETKINGIETRLARIPGARPGLVIARKDADGTYVVEGERFADLDAIRERFGADVELFVIGRAE